VTTCPHFDALLVGDACYHCLKLKALNGGRFKLSYEQLEYCGCLPEQPPERGWRPAWTILPALDGTEDGDPEAARGIRYLMKVGKDRMERSI
jgi:hypothetical protein